MLTSGGDKWNGAYSRSINQTPHLKKEMAVPWRIHILGWYKNPSVALISSQIRIFWNKPNSHRLVRAASTFATTDSSTSVANIRVETSKTDKITNHWVLAPWEVKYTLLDSFHLHMPLHQRCFQRMPLSITSPCRSGRLSCGSEGHHWFSVSRGIYKAKRCHEEQLASRCLMDP